MHISAIVAISENRVMGKNNQLPWHLPADLRHFKEITLGKPIIMGRKTFESIGRPLPGRQNIVITRDKTFQAPGCSVFHSIDSALSALNEEEAFIIGGAQLFEQMMPRIECIYLTIIHENFEGDVVFPELDISQWKEIDRLDCQPDEKNMYSYSFITLCRCYVEASR